jgi:hypothetical protein
LDTEGDIKLYWTLGLHKISSKFLSGCTISGSSRMAQLRE